MKAWSDKEIEVVCIKSSTGLTLGKKYKINLRIFEKDNLNWDSYYYIRDDFNRMTFVEIKKSFRTIQELRKSKLHKIC